MPLLPKGSPIHGGRVAQAARFPQPNRGGTGLATPVVSDVQPLV
ncbi:hypothetical protein [Komagataeibacter oboediens]